MKKLIFLLILVPMIGFSQFIGQNKKECISNMVSEGIPVIEKYSPKWGTYIVGTTNDFIILCTFTSNVCYDYAIYPQHKGAIHSMIEFYNNNFVILSPTSWRQYINGIVIEIAYDTSDKPVFIAIKIN